MATPATDWDTYYQNVPATAKLTRRYTTSVLLNALRRATTESGDGEITLIEIGGANSCFLEAILHDLRPRFFDVVDTNAYGLSLLAKRTNGDPRVRVHQESVLDMSLPPAADAVFSVGLIEHFDEASTRAAVLAHFRVVRPGGIVVITFPTPTFLYRATRRLIEAIGRWKFYDERPLSPEEVLRTVRECGDVLEERTLWPLCLTQHLIVARRTN